MLSLKGTTNTFLFDSTPQVPWFLPLECMLMSRAISNSINNLIFCHGKLLAFNFQHFHSDLHNQVIKLLFSTPCVSSAATFPFIQVASQLVSQLVFPRLFKQYFQSIFLKYHVSFTDGKISIKIGIIFIFRFHRRPIQKVVFFAVGISSLSHLVSKFLLAWACRELRSSC